MERLLQAVGWVLVLVAIAHAGQHLVSDTGLEGDATEPIWIAFDILMLIGLPVAIAISFRRFVKSRTEDVAERLLASFMPILVVVTSILFIEQLITVELLAPEGYEITEARLALWEAIDIMSILVMAWVGIHLIRSKGARLL